ncbi:hypothetical protein [Inhella proteolytica]|uniref:DUF4276 family protein n=1 Tax=Inhella proteolytica TaxID=2795029 RepID=A0A931J6V6_9BURK|nr:hypothetical protein [Inhella proteolytica]MBH9579340.1 hypothetical protein [Inhella proteolytica]
MHLEVLVEDSSGARLIEILLPKLIGEQGLEHSWRVHDHRGIGRLPSNLQAKPDPSKSCLLDKLPALLRAYGKTPGIDAVLVVLDSDQRPALEFRAELEALSGACSPAPPTVLIRLAVEEVEAWYFGDQAALLAAYPRAKKKVLAGYRQDSVCGTWELLADAVYPGGAAAVKKAGWPLPGQLKHDWAAAIGPRMDVERNKSPSFGELREGLRRLIA